MGIIYTHLTKKAMKICFAIHKEQKDKSGMPYVFHPFHLAEQMQTEDEICTALLHDVLEDSEMTLHQLAEAGFSEDTLAALQLLTHDKNVPYMDYITALKEHPIARKVKLADLAHNSDTGRLDVITEKDKKRLQKYQQAKKILEGSLYE